MKNTMNSRDIARFHKFLEADVPKESIIKDLGVDGSTLAKFTPKKIEAAKANLLKKQQAEQNSAAE